MLKKMITMTLVVMASISVNANAKEIKNQLNIADVTVDQISDSNYVLDEDEISYLELNVTVYNEEVNRIEVRDTNDRELTKSGSIYYVDAIDNGSNDINVEVGYYTNTKSVDIEVWDNFGELLYFGQTEINVEHPVVETVSENSISQNTVSANTVEATKEVEEVADNTEVEETETTKVEEVVETAEVEEYDNDAADDSWNEESEVVVAHEVNEASEDVDDDIDVDDDEVEEVEQVKVSKPSVSSKLSKNKLKVKIKADKGTKLEIKYSTNGKTWKTKTYSASAKNINFKFKKKNLKIKVKIRAYKIVNGNKIYSDCISISKKCK